MTHTLELTEGELIAARGIICAGLFTGTPNDRSALYDKVDKAYDAMRKGKAPEIDGKAEGGRTAPSDQVDASPVCGD